jgi:hypothetical protein
MKTFLLLSVLFFTSSAFSQTIFKGLEFGMTRDEAVDAFRADRDEYTTVDIGNNFKYRIYQQNFIYEDGKLTGVNFRPKGSAFGQSYDEATSYLEHTRQFFENLDYEVFFEPEYWNAPQSFKSKYGLLMVNPEKTVMAQVYPTKTTAYNNTTYLVLIDLYNYDDFLKTYKNEEEKQQKIRESSGF